MLRRATPLKTGSRSELRKKKHASFPAPHPLVYREEERHRALGRDATFSWSRALTHPPRCNRSRHRDRHLVSDFVGAAILDLTPWGRHLGSEVVGAAILDLTSRGPPSWTGSRGGRHLGPEVTSNALKWYLYYFLLIIKLD